MTLGDVVDKLHDKHSLTHTCTTEQTNLTTLHVRLQKVNDLDTRCEHLLVCGKILKLGRLTVDRISTLHAERAHTVNRLTDDVHHTTLDLLTCRHHNGIACRNNLQATLQSVGIVHCDAAYGIFADVLLHLNDKLLSVRTLKLQSFVNFRQHLFRVLSGCIEVNVDNRADNLRDATVDL